MDKTIKLLSSITTKALDDGIITEDERALLDYLGNSCGIGKYEICDPIKA